MGITRVVVRYLPFNGVGQAVLPDAPPISTDTRCSGRYVKSDILSVAELANVGQNRLPNLHSYPHKPAPCGFFLPCAS
ncbi:hypothetical protein [Methylovulum psychrotolerans]|uniref:hypothetical protein n=1 Tax=Methylovulum psychrotolerans TaxID=1704499 RepID=UPI0011B03416|nr:hypothetical protein [Methylovulum psychrotolerans]